MTASSAQRSKKKLCWCYFFSCRWRGIKFKKCLRKKFVPQQTKMFQREQKMFAMKIASNWKEKREFKVTKSCFNGHLGLERHIQVLYGLLWYCVALHCLYGNLWSWMALLWQNIDLIWLVWSFLPVIDPNWVIFIIKVLNLNRCRIITRPNEFGSVTARKDDIISPIESIFYHKRL